MTYAEWIESLTIFAKYHKDGLDGYPMSRARHQELWFGCSADDLSPEDKKRLEELGWSHWEGYGLMHQFM